ncbi:Dynamitin-domain-containing protein [Catenaria anguillulae PL171]|uniref:Dynamitin-domain-containing protein n=1 Tax=Catenaria anguillulae PL171 TaxID=765915 RepID=A0A1Y2HCN3_9FUNG|nr:Dynamitin-domain-containing protein [Catenaria anguillulae PL171]
MSSSQSQFQPYARQHHDDKFRNLPDIDRESPDTYETPDSLDAHESHAALGYDTVADTPANTTPDAHSAAAEEGIIHSRLPLADAKSRFHGAGVDASNPGPSGLRTYDKSKYDALLRARTATETPLQRLARLKAEALELEEQLQAGVHSPSSPDSPSAAAAAPKYADAFAQLSALTKSLDHITATVPASATSAEGGVTATRLLDHIKAFRDSAASSPAPYRQFSGTDYSTLSTATPTGAATTHAADTITYEVYYTPDSATLIRSTKLSDLDTRLATLEKLLGHHVEPDLVPSEPLVGMLARIDRQLQYLANPRNLDALTRQLRSVNDQLAAAARHSQGSAMDVIDGDLAAKLTHLYALVNKLDPLLPVIPRVLERLQSLQSLHAEAAQITGAVRKTVVDVARTERTVRDVADSVRQLEASVRENAEVTAKNVEALERRIKEVAARVEKFV